MWHHGIRDLYLQEGERKAIALSSGRKTRFLQIGFIEPLGKVTLLQRKAIPGCAQLTQVPSKRGAGNLSL